jgi:hypothetical protein
MIFEPPLSATLVSRVRGFANPVEKLNPWLLIDFARQEMLGVLLHCKETRYASPR